MAQPYDLPDDYRYLDGISCNGEVVSAAIGREQFDRAVFYWNSRDRRHVKLYQGNPVEAARLVAEIKRAVHRDTFDVTTYLPYAAPPVDSPFYARF